MYPIPKVHWNHEFLTYIIIIKGCYWKIKSVNKDLPLISNRIQSMHEIIIVFQKRNNDKIWKPVFYSGIKFNKDAYCPCTCGLLFPWAWFILVWPYGTVWQNTIPYIGTEILIFIALTPKCYSKSCFWMFNRWPFADLINSKACTNVYKLLNWSDRQDWFGHVPFVMNHQKWP